MNLISDIFKSSMTKDCERTLHSLEKEGFEKSFGVYGTESTLTYRKGDIELTVMWETQDGNPWFLIKTENQRIGLEEFESEVRHKYDFIKHGQQNFMDWTWKIMNRIEYLELIEKRIKNMLQQSI